MYQVSVTRSFVAQHVLTVPEPGPEGERHSHHYTVTVAFEGDELDAHGYLVDIDVLTEALEHTVDSLGDRFLNDLRAFEGKNPSVERLASVVADRLLGRCRPPTASRIRVTVDEDDVATVSYERPI